MNWIIWKLRCWLWRGFPETQAKADALYRVEAAR